ncbi:class I SAM-dependent methyltransferase [Nakamurella sp. GG22]
MSSLQGPAGVFDRAADTYDAVGVPWFRPIAARLVDELAVQPGERALDIGCGRGAALFPLAEAVGSTGSVVGIDLSPRMVELTAAEATDLPQVRVRVGNAVAPDLPPSSFDVIASSLVLFFLPDPAGAMARWADLLVPGGRLGISTFGPQDANWKRIDATFFPYLSQGMLDARTSGARGPFASDAGVEELFRGAGLNDIRTVSKTVRATFRNAEQLIEFSWSHGQRAMWEAVPEAERPGLRQQITDLVDEVRGGSGALNVHQEVRYTFGSRP